MSIVDEGHFPTIAALADASQLVIQGSVGPAPRVVPADELGRGNVHATIFDIHITQAYKKDAPKVGSVVAVRQLGDFRDSGAGDDDAPMLQPGKTYTLFLKQFEFHPAKPTSEWVLVSSGMYEMSGSKGTRCAQSADIPATIDLAQLQPMKVAR